MEQLKYSEILKQNAALRVANREVKPYRIKVLSNITCNQLGEVLSFRLYSEQLNPVIEFGNYDNIVQESYRCQQEDLVVVNYDLVNLLDKHPAFVESFNEEEMADVVESVKQELDLILDNLASVPTLVFNTFSSKGLLSNALFPLKCQKLAETLNAHLREARNTNLHVLDLEVPLSRVGTMHAFDHRMYFLSKTLYTIDFWKAYSACLLPLIVKSSGKAKKAIIFDCDNTLWKGILGEDGESGIEMSSQSKIGQIFHKVQQIAVWLSGQGVLIGLCSKNNAADVEQLLENHSDMLLRKDDLVISRINWEDKATNLREIAAELNIGLDSILFVDDSSFEINLVREQLPMVQCMQVPVAIHEYPELLLNTVSKHFYLSGSSADLEKKEQYKSQVLRNETKRQFQSIEDYLSSIGLELTVHVNDRGNIDRIAQLTQKTNQFNLTTKRYTETQVESFMNNDKMRVFSFDVRDKFGDSGLTAVCILALHGDAFVDTFLMSCRIMGRNLEKAIMDVLVAECRKLQCDRMRSQYLKTAKNAVVSTFYDEMGFTAILEENEERCYELRIPEYNYNQLNYITIKE